MEGKRFSSTEKQNEELKQSYFDLENKFKITKESNDSLIDQLETKLKAIKALTSKVEDKDGMLASLK